MSTLLFLAAVAIVPAAEMRAAAGDAARLPAHEQPDVRYLTLYAIESRERDEAEACASYVLNALSRSRAISRPKRITPTLLRFHLSQYAPRADERAAWIAAWEQLVERDPYFHLQTEVAIQGRTKVVAIDGGWTDLAAAVRLQATTGSSGAILRVDDFLARACVAPAYYDFAGIPHTENEFLASLGIDRQTIDRLCANAGANLVASAVTAKPRRVVWSQGPLGGVYATLDVERVDATRDPLRRPVSAAGFAMKYDASEWFALAPNGLWRTAIFDARGRRQDAVPDRVAKDTSDPLGDGIVVPMLSCIRCHRESGLRPFRDDQTGLLEAGADLRSYDPKIVQRAAEFYDEPRLQRQMAFDRATYDQAVRRATGMKSDELCDALARQVRAFAYLPVTLDRAAREVGLAPDQFRNALRQTHDPVILLLLADRPVLRAQWESSFAEAALAATAQAHQHAKRSPTQGDHK